MSGRLHRAQVNRLLLAAAGIGFVAVALGVVVLGSVLLQSLFLFQLLFVSGL